MSSPKLSERIGFSLVSRTAKNVFTTKKVNKRKTKICTQVKASVYTIRYGEIIIGEEDTPMCEYRDLEQPQVFFPVKSLFLSRNATNTRMKSNPL